MLARELDTRHPLRFRAGPRGVLAIAVARPEHKVDASAAAQAVPPTRHGRSDFDPIAGGHLDGLRSRRHEARTPATVSTYNRVRLVRAARSPVHTREDKNEPGSPAPQGSLLELRRRRMPVDLAHGDQI